MSKIVGKQTISGIRAPFIYVQNRATGEVTKQSPKFVNCAGALDTHKVLSLEDGEPIYNEQESLRAKAPAPLSEERFASLVESPVGEGDSQAPEEPIEEPVEAPVVKSK